MICKRFFGMCLLSLMILAIFSSCGEEIDLGYPAKVSLNPDGGEVELKGSSLLTALDLYEGDMRGELFNPALDSEATDEREDDMINIGGMRLPWISVICVQNKSNPRLRVNVSPNETGRKRKVVIHCFRGNDWCEIEAVQGSK